MSGICTSRGDSVCRSTTRSTWTMTMPPELCAAWAIDSASSVTASRSMVMFPAKSAVVPRRNATATGMRG
jgi:hypothetical protein